MNTGRLRRAPETVPDVQPIVPVRVDLRVNEAAMRELVLHLSRVNDQITQLRGFASTIPVESDIPAQLARSRRTLEQMGLSSVPILGDFYQDDLRRIERLFSQAQSSFDSGNRLDAGRFIHAARAQMSNLGEVLSIQTDILRHVPSGSNSGPIVDALVNSLDSVVVDVGTANEKRFANVLRAARHYLAHSETYNSQNSPCTAGRNAIFAYIIQRGNDARSGTAYSRVQDENDAAMLDRFDRSIFSLETTFRSEVVRVVQGWSDNLARLSMMGVSQAAVHDLLLSLRTDVDRLLVNLRDQSTLDMDNVREVGRRYYAQTGSQETQSILPEFDTVTLSALSLRGNETSVLPGSPAWFGSMALDALNHGERARAALAVAVGNFAQMVQGSPSTRVETLFPRQRSTLAIDIISGAATTDSATLNSLISQVRAASLVLDREKFENRARTFLRTARGEISTRFNAILRAITARQSDEAGMRRLLTMASTYLDILIHNPRANLSRIAGAVDHEVSGTNAELDFRLGLTAYRFTTRSEALRRESSDWADGVSRQRQVFTTIISRAERAINEGDFTNASLFLSLADMYSQTIELFGVRRNGQIQSVNSRFDDSSMAASISALLASPSQGGLTAFAAQFDQSRSLFVRLNVDRLRELATSRQFGQTTINAALSATLERSSRGDVAGALLLLGYVTEFYGSATAASGRTPARNEGWRYAQFSVRNSPLRPVAQRLLDTITLELGATTDSAHESAAATFVRARQRVDSTPLLVAEATRLSGILNGSAPFLEGVTTTVGQVPLGTRQADGSYPSYLAITAIRQYEQANASTDPVLSGGQTLETILAEVTRAATAGDVNSFRAARAAFFTRFELVANRTIRAQNIASIVASIDQNSGVLSSAIDRLSQTHMVAGPAPSARRYGQMAPSPARTAQAIYPDAIPRVELIRRDTEALDQLRVRFTALSALSTPIPQDLLDQYVTLVSRTEQSVRIVNAYFFIQNEISALAAYARAVDPNGTRSEVQVAVNGELVASSISLRAAADSLLLGDFEGARREYRVATAHRIAALTLQSASPDTRRRGAERTANEYIALLVGGSVGPGGFTSGGGSNIGGSQFGSGELNNFRMYFDAANSLFGNLTASPSELIRVQQQAATATATDIRAASMLATNPNQIVALQRNLAQIDDSIFCVSPRTGANVLGVMGNIADYQRRVRETIYVNSSTARADSERLLTDIQTISRQNQQFVQYTTLAVTAPLQLVGIGEVLFGSAAIGAWLLRGAFALQMAYQVHSEMETRGTVSAQTLAMMGFMAVTEGIGGLSTHFRNAANLSRPLSQLSELELGALQISRDLAAANIVLGAGFSAYMIPGVVDQFRNGHIGEGLLNATLLLGGLAAVGVGARQLVVEGRTLTRFRALQERPLEVIDNVSHDPALLDPVPSPANPTLLPPEMNPYTVEGLFNLLRRMTTAAGRAEVAPMLETLPQSVRDAINHLAEDATFMGLVERGATTAISPQLQNVVSGFVPRPSGGGQIMFGTPVRTTRSAPRFSTPDAAWEYLTNPNNTDPAIIEDAYSLLSPADAAIARQMRRQMDLGRANRGTADPTADPNLVAQRQNNPQGAADQPQLMIDAEGNVISVGGGRPAPRRPGLRMAGQDPAAPTTTAPPAQRTLLGDARNALYELTIGNANARYRRYLEARDARNNPQAASEQFLGSDGRQALEDTLVNVTPEARRTTSVRDPAVTDAPDPVSVYESADARLAEIVRALNRDVPPVGSRGTDNPAVNLLRRIFTPENVRARVAELARTNPREYGDIGQIMNDIVRGNPDSPAVAFEGSPISLPDGVGGIIPPEHPFTTAEMNLVVRALEARSATELPAARARLESLEATSGPAIREFAEAQAEERRLADPQANASPDEIMAARDRLSDATEAIRPLIEARQAVALNSPLGRTQFALGVELTSAQRARLLVDNPVSASGTDFPGLHQSSVTRAATALRTIEAEYPAPVAGATETSPARALRELRGRLRAGGDLDSALFEILKSHNEIPADSTSLQQFLESPVASLPENNVLVAFINRVRNASITTPNGATISLADEMAATAVYRTRAGEIASNARIEAAAIAADDLTWSERFAPVLGRIEGAMERFGDFSNDYIVPSAYRARYSAWRATHPNSPFVYGAFAPSNLVHAIPSLALWVGLPIYLYSSYRREQERLFNRGQLEMFDALARRNGVSRDDVIFAGSIEGRAYLGTVSNLHFFPVDPTTGVSSPQVRLHPIDMGEVVDSVYRFGDRNVIYPSHAGDILALGARANRLLPRINELLRTNNRAELGRIFVENSPLADQSRLPISVADVSAYMRQNNITTLSISDLGNLINRASVRLGIGGPTREVVIDAYLYDRRLVSYPGDPRNATDARRQYLVQHPNAFALTWYLTNNGFLPSSATGAAIELFMDDQRLQGAFARRESNVPASEVASRTRQVRTLIELSDNAQIEAVVRRVTPNLNPTQLASRVSDIRTRQLLGMTNDERNAYITTLLELVSPALSANGIFADPPIAASSLLEHVDLNLVAPRPGTDPAQLTQIRELLYGRTDSATSLGLFAQGREDRGLLVALNSFNLIYDSAHPENNEVLIGNPVDVITIVRDQYNLLKNDQTRASHESDGVDAAAAALRIARERGYVTYGLLLTIDPRMNSLEGRELTAFIRRTTVDGRGMMEWIAANAEHFHQNNLRNGPVSLLEVIRGVRRAVEARQPAGANTIFGQDVIDMANGLVPSFKHDHLWFPEEEPRNTPRRGAPNEATVRATAIETSLQRGTPRISRVVMQGTGPAVQTLQQQVTTATNALPTALREEIGTDLEPGGMLESLDFIHNLLINNGWRAAAGRLSSPAAPPTGPFNAYGLVLERFMTAPNTTPNHALRDYIYFRIHEMASATVRGVDSEGNPVSAAVLESRRTLLASAGIQVTTNTSQPAANRSVNITFTHQNRTDGMMGLLTTILGGSAALDRTTTAGRRR